MKNGDRLYWKGKFEALQSKIQDLYEKECVFEMVEQPDECISASEVFFISNSMEVVDNERYAKNHWGKGKYFKVIKPFKYTPSKK